MRKLKSLHFRKRVTTLSVNFLPNYSLIFIQLLSTVDAWVDSNTLMTLFILPNHPGEKLEEMIPFLQSLWSLLPAQREGDNTEISQSPRRTFVKYPAV